MSYLPDRLLNRTEEYNMTTDQISSTFAALADPTRRAILTTLRAGEASVQELARPFDMSLPGISKHLKVLEHAGLIERSRQAQWRPCRLQAGPLKEAADWLEHYRTFWEESFDRLEAYLKQIQLKDKKRGRERSRKKSSARSKVQRRQHAREK
jgi:DNA-binding transcriptional ArsR family regulator